MRWPTEISSFGGEAFAGDIVPFPAIAVIVEGVSKCDVHNASSAEESISGLVRK